MDLRDQFPDLFFDIKQVEERTPKAVVPSVHQVISKVLANSGISNTALASDISTAVDQYYQQFGKKS